MPNKNQWVLVATKDYPKIAEVIKNGQSLPEDCEILTKEAYEDLCLRASKEQEDGNK